MKNKKIVIGLAIYLTMLLAGCENAKYDVIDNGLYIKEAFASKGIMSRKVAIDADNVEIRLTPALSSAFGADIKAEFSVDASLLEEYNLANETSYEILPQEFYILPDPVTIAAGKSSDATAKITVKPYTAAQGVQYALPLAVKSSSVSALPTSSKYILLLDKPLIQSVPYMNYTSHLKCEPLDESGNMISNWGLELNEWSLEFWVWMDGFRINNQALFDSDEIYVRFGDAPIPYNLLQVKLRGTQVNTVTAFVPLIWTHVALTYDATGLFSIYINGVRDVTLQTKGGAVPTNYLQMVCSGATYFRNNCQMAQIRFWNRCITASQIESNRFYSLKPSNDMIGYWRMDEGQGNICYDCTPNARHAHASAPLTWNNNTRFDGK